ncbi:MAG: thioredoxin domain-containing protein [Flavobacteriales bacterium]
MLRNALAAFTVIVLALDLNAQGIEFSHKPWDEVLTQAKAEHKYIFVDCYTIWCGPCKMMEREIFPLKEVGAFYNEHFINVKLDMENDSDGVALSKTHKIRAYPTYLYFAPNGEIVHRSQGASSEFKKFIQTGKDAMNAETQVYALKKKYDEHSDDPEWLLLYMAAMSDAGENIREDFKRYEEMTDSRVWMKKKNWDQITTISVPFDSKVFAFVANNRDSLGEKDMQPFIHQIQFYYLMKGSFKDEGGVQQIRETIVRVLDEPYEKAALAELEMLWLRRHKPKEAWPATVNFLDNYCREPFHFNDVCWDIAESDSSDLETIQKALTWIDKAIDVHRMYQYVDTKAWLIYRSGDRMQAKALAREAIELANEEGRDHTSSDDLLGLIGE